MYAICKKGLCKSRKYRLWLEKNIPEMSRQMDTPERYPIEVDIVVVQGRDWGPKNDVDNVCKPIIDCLVKAAVIPDDSVQYISRVRARYMPLTAKGEAVTRISYEMPDLESGTEWGSPEEPVV